ncbi:PREDICTED: uncharacterized protein LOC104788746 [Camelina sativa]|uniref:Uncharacterized protein LOC104788746 n=1 Tax=Camelina sativa TaxID=90675 RepID=A0ABM0ZAP5_CAMSA|nr:PREDICTED: uncharacterized protein LOC104788746 [Camelina sativa]
MGPVSEQAQMQKVADLLIEGSQEWDLEKIADTVPGYKHRITSLRPSKLGGKDKWAWLPSSSGVYTVKSGYYMALHEEPKDNPESQTTTAYNWKAKLWRIKCSPKIKILLWKALHDALPVGENLKHRQINMEAKCIHCGEEETTLHLFFKCHFAREIWNASPCEGLMNVDRLTTFQQGFEAAKSLKCLPPVGLGEGNLTPWIFWAIWHSRNKRIFEDKELQPMEIITQATVRAKEWTYNQIKSNQPTKVQEPPDLITVDGNTIRCNSDAAWNTSKQAGLGWISKNHRGITVDQGSTPVSNVHTPLVAEGLAMLQAVTSASNLGLTHLIFASDSINLVKAIKSENQPKELHGILCDILKISQSFSHVSFRFIPRSNNVEADCLAKNALASSVMGLAH